MKRLLLVRHAKSSWDDHSLEDFERPLNKRGKKDAPRMGSHLKSKREAAPGLVICSTAKRACETAELLLGPLGYDPNEVVYNREIYDGEADDVLGLIQGVDDVHDQVLLIGHNPDISDLAGMLSGEQVQSLPTCAVFCLDFDVSAWQDVVAGAGKKVFLDVPKEI